MSNEKHNEQDKELTDDQVNALIDRLAKPDPNEYIFEAAPLEYMMFQNTGEILPDAFKYIGASTKVDDESMIGEFGSGANYAIAYLIRKKIPFRIFSGSKEIVFSEEKIDFRGKKFHAISVNGSTTSITTEMGKDWNAWYAIREFWCNSLDEKGSHRQKVSQDYIEGQDGVTRVFIQINEYTSEVWNNWNNYFSEGRVDAIQKEPKPNGYGVDVYRGSGNPVIYRKGIRVTTNNWRSSQIPAFHYDMSYCHINEYREIANEYMALNNIIGYLMGKANENTVRHLINVFQENVDRQTGVFEYHLHWSDFRINNPESWISALEGKQICEYEQGGHFADLFTNNTIVLPGGLVGVLVKQKIAEHVSGREYRSEGTVIQLTKHQQAILHRAQYFLKEVGFDMPYTMTFIQFKNRQIMGLSDMDTQIISISDKAFSSTADLVKCIIQQTIVLDSGCEPDNNRFEHALVDTLLLKMQEYTSQTL